MRHSNSNKNIKFYEIQGADHFNIIAPITKFLAGKINQDQAPENNISFSGAELSIIF